jgi:lysozyme
METDSDIGDEAKSFPFLRKTKLMLAFAAGIFLSITLGHEENVNANTALLPQPETPVVMTTNKNVRPIHSVVSGAASNYKLHGVDVSRYQREVDWASIRQAGISFAFIKATEGVSLVDSFFVKNWNGARGNKISRGAYHFFLAEKDADVQAVNFLLNVNLAPGDLPPVLDVETTRGMSGRQIRAGMRTWLTIVEKYTGVKPIIYSNPTFYNKYLAGYFDDYHFWIASYNSKKKKAAPEIKWQFWQHTDVGRLDGVAKEIDLNVFNGDSSAFMKLTVPHVDSKKTAAAFRVPS